MFPEFTFMKRSLFSAVEVWPEGERRLNEKLTLAADFANSTCCIAINYCAMETQFNCFNIALLPVELWRLIVNTADLPLPALLQLRLVAKRLEWKYIYRVKFRQAHSTLKLVALHALDLY